MVDSTAPFSLRKCLHCNAPFRPRREDDAYCCSGCRVVRELIEGEGFSNFYELLGKRSLNPLDDQPINEAVTDWLEPYLDDESGTLSVKVANLSCTACVWLIERLFRKKPGGIRIEVNTSRSSLTLWWTPRSFDLIGFARDMHRFGYPLSKQTDDDEEEAAFSESRALLTRLGVTGGLALNTMAFTLPSYLGLSVSDSLSGLFRLVAFASSTLALAVGGSWFFQRAFAAFRARIMHMDVPITIGLLAAYLGSLIGVAAGSEQLLYFDFVATFVTLMLLGRWLHVRMIEHNRYQLKAREKSVVSLQKKTASSGFEAISTKEIELGDHIKILPGSLVPVSGILLSPDSARISLDWINGEPEPFTIHCGEVIPTGARNASGEGIQVRAEHDFSGTLMDKLLSTRASDVQPSDSFYGKVLQLYLVIVICLAVLGFVGWLLFAGDWIQATQVLISVMVVSCPCALGLALPLVDEIVNSRMRQLGVFVRRNQLWQKLPGIKHIVLDKTGTLTEPVPRLLNPEILESLDSESRAALAILTRRNRHPHGSAVREAILSSFGEIGLEGEGESEEVVSCGVRARVAGNEWRFGKQSWATDDPEGADTVLSKNGMLVARFVIGESIREGAAEEITRLQSAGFFVQVLSGDPNLDRVLETGNALKIPVNQIHAAQSPQQKADFIQQNEPRKTLFVGDGGNDSLALDSAICSGSPATGIRAVEGRTDFVFMGRNFRAISHLLRAAKRRRMIVRTIFAVAVGYNIVAITICLAGLMNPLLAAVLMPISSLVTTFIATRAKR